MCRDMSVERSEHGEGRAGRRWGPKVTFRGRRFASPIAPGRLFRPETRQVQSGPLRRGEADTRKARGQTVRQCRRVTVSPLHSAPCVSVSVSVSVSALNKSRVSSQVQPQVPRRKKKEERVESSRVELFNSLPQPGAVRGQYQGQRRRCVCTAQYISSRAVGGVQSPLLLAHVAVIGA